MEERTSKIQMNPKYLIHNVLLVITFYFGFNYVHLSRAQSIGYHPQFNFGFNPYTSPVFGYGVGLPFGAYNMSPVKYPSLMNAIPPAPYADKHGLMSKIHAKAFLKKLASTQVLSSGYYGLKDKLNLMKHPEFAFTPYSAAYGYGKHYGAAIVPNNPYKSTYGDFYDNADSAISRPLTAASNVDVVKSGHIPIGGRLPESTFSSNSGAENIKTHVNFLKPLIKAGAMLTTAALLGKKVVEGQMRLNPSGMILSGVRP